MFGSGSEYNYVYPESSRVFSRVSEREALEFANLELVFRSEKKCCASSMRKMAMFCMFRLQGVQAIRYSSQLSNERCRIAIQSLGLRARNRDSGSAFTVGCEILNMPGIVLCSPTVVVPWFLTALSIALFLSNMPLCHSLLFCLCFLSSALHPTPSRTTSVARYYKRPASGPIVCVCARARRRARVYLSL